MTPTSRIEINLTALERNGLLWRNLLRAGCEVCAVVKADAYGLGAVPIANGLARAGIHRLAVYTPAQAVELLEARADCRLLVLMPVHDLDEVFALLHPGRSHRVELTIHSPAQLERLASQTEQYRVPVGVHIEVDTGMSRGGMDALEVPGALERLRRSSSLHLRGLFSHAASADIDPPRTERQWRALQQVLAQNRHRLPAGLPVHFAGTFAALRSRRYHGRMVRLGRGLYGYAAPEGQAVAPEDFSIPRLRPVLRWTSRIVHVRHVEAGQAVGYQGSWVASRPTRLGLVPVGHADGYPLGLSNRGVVRVGPDRACAAVRGQVNMDQITVDLTDAPCAASGTEVELVGDDPHAPNALPRLAELAGSSSYELLCRLSPRLERRYVRSPSMPAASGDMPRAVSA